jgi:hypothetical protein
MPLYAGVVGAHYRTRKMFQVRRRAADTTFKRGCCAYQKFCRPVRDRASPRIVWYGLWMLSGQLRFVKTWRLGAIPTNSLLRPLQLDFLAREESQN